MPKVVTPEPRDGEQILQSQSSFDLRLYPPQTIAAFVAELVAQGIDVAAALEGSGLSDTQLGSHNTKISYRQIDRILRNVLRLSKDPTIALRAGLRTHVTALGIYGYALLSSATALEAVQLGERYIQVVGPLCRFASSHDDTHIAVTFHSEGWPLPQDEVHRLAIEFALASHLTTTRDRSGERFEFSRVFLDYPAPTHVKAYEDLFGCPVLFEQSRSGYEHVRNDAPLNLADSRTNEMARDMCAQVLQEIVIAGGAASDVQRVLMEQPGQFPSFEEIAVRLGTYTRALRRRLAAEGTSYRRLKSEMCVRLATDYLRKTQMTHEEIASRLGYSDAANFRQAFMRWTGKNPIEVRRAREK